MSGRCLRRAAERVVVLLWGDGLVLGCGARRRVLVVVIGCGELRRLVVVVLAAGDRVLELAHAGTQRLAQSGQLLGPEDDEHDDEHDGEFEWSDAKWHGQCSLGLGSEKATATSG
jgi:hypothetical protein